MEISSLPDKKEFVMRVENVNGRNLLCGGILPKDQLRVGQKWAQADGADRVVEIRAIEPYGDIGELDIIYGVHGNDTSYTKDSFSFQCRYCLVVE